MVKVLFHHCLHAFDILKLEKARSCDFITLTHFSPVSHCYNPRKRQKTKSFRGYRNVALTKMGKILKTIIKKLF